MKTLIIAALGLVTLNTAFAAEIPKPFQGVWGDNKKVCTAKDALADTQVVVKKNGYSGYEFGCELKKVKKATENHMVAKFTCYVEGESSDSEETFTLTDNGKKLIINESETPLIRCK